MNLRITYQRTDSLIEYANNPRENDHAVDKMAAAIREYDCVVPLLIKSDLSVVDGHLRLKAARKLQLEELPCILVDHLSDVQIKALRISINKMAEIADWDVELLALEIDALKDAEYDLSLIGFDQDEVDALVDEASTEDSGADEIPEASEEEPRTRLGNVWLCGEHRVMCGDSTDAEQVERLMDGELVDMVHADPPYGMGKEKDGVLNDNLYLEKLDEFQAMWLRGVLLFLTPRAAIYVWGNAPDLWRWWYGVSGPATLCEVTLKNDITWDKKNIAGMKSPLMLQYHIASEHALFFTLGKEFKGCVNSEDFPDVLEPLLAYLKGEVDSIGLRASDVQRLFGVQMFSHWFSRSQFTLIPKKYYEILQQTYPTAFRRNWESLKTEYNSFRSCLTQAIRGKRSEIRSYFDNAHAVMTDVWDFPRVFGEERHGHATPKPVAMTERCIVSSCPPEGSCYEPFLGSGTTLIACEKTDRRCFGMELDPKYCDVIVKRWQDYTGEQAVLEATGETFYGS